MTNEYFRQGLLSFHALHIQRGHIFALLNETQQTFVDFLTRPGTLKRRVDEFCDSFNRFTSEYPELVGKEETRKELTGRVNILSN